VTKPSLAVITLLGWYLMYPPMTADYKNRANAPLTQWGSGKSFDTAKECEAARLGLRQQRTNLDAFGHDFAENITSAQCVATDDPRLKGD
jgi:hypothetical protein